MVAMLNRLKNVFVQVCVPDEQDMMEHYRTPAERPPTWSCMWSA